VKPLNYPAKMLAVGLGMGVLELAFLTWATATEAATGLRIVSMLAASHVAGRLAFIGAGFEVGFDALTVMAIASFHNTMVVLITYPAFLLVSERLGVVGRLFAGLQEKVRSTRNLRTRWNLAGIAVFVWVPLPMTGAVIGALIAHFEGFAPRQVLAVVLGAMIVGVVTCTLAFEPLYKWMNGMGPHVTLGLTIFLLLLPLLIRPLRRSRSGPTVKTIHRAWPSPKL